MGVKKLRDYQIETINNIVESIKRGNRSIIVQQPPRTGKTVIMAEIARRTTLNDKRVLFIVHRKEIVNQAKTTFEEQNVDMRLAKLGMVQTITRHIDKLKSPDVIFIDEAHHAKAKSYQRIISAFPKAIKLLFTATPWRMDGNGFEEVADDLIQGKTIQWLINNGHLAPIDYYAPSEIDISKLKTRRNGEFDDKSVDEAFKPKIYGNAVKTFIELAGDKQAIAYTHNVSSADKFANELNKNGIIAKSVSGATPKNERQQIIQDYRDGKIQVVTNAELFTEGLDLPNVDCVIMLRPTQSLSLFLQFSMRAMNPRENKRAILIDHVGNVNRFGLPTMEREWQLYGFDKESSGQSNREQIKGVAVCPECFGTFYRAGCECPYCGATLNVEDELEVIKDAKLVKVESDKRLKLAKKIIESESANNIAGKSISELKTMAELKSYAKLHHYKPGWIYHQAKLKGMIKS